MDKRTAVPGFIISASMVIIGVVLTAAQVPNDDPSWLGVTAGTILTTLGGVYASWIASGHLGEQASQRVIGQQIDSVSRGLVQSMVQIDQALYDADQQFISESEALSLVGQASSSIEGQISELQEVVGRPFSTDSRERSNEAAKRLRQLMTEKLGREPSPQELAEVSKLAVQAGLEQVECPHCDATNEIDLGDARGFTSHETCNDCGGRYTAHRAQPNQPPITRKYVRPGTPRLASSPAVADRTSLNQPCPTCNVVLSTTVAAGDKPRNVTCFDCASALRFDPSDGSLTFDVQLDTANVDQYSGLNNRGTRPVVECQCGKRQALNIAREDRLTGKCNGCSTVLYADRSHFEAWRDHHRD